MTIMSNCGTELEYMCNKKIENFTSCERQMKKWQKSSDGSYFARVDTYKLHMLL